MTAWIGAAEAAKLLGVKPSTLYAYVSRGVLRRRRSPDRRSLFDPAEIEQLARRGRPRRPTGQEFVVESRITSLGQDRPYYRGRDALDLAARYPLEAVAGWLWTGEPSTLDTAEPPAWRAALEAVEAARAAQSGLPTDVLPLERLQIIAPVLAALDPVRLNLDTTAVIAVGQSLIAGMVESLPGIGGTGSVAARLWPRLTAARPDAGLVDVLRAALVVLADHELAASTLAARVAAAVRSDPYSVVIAALGVMGGPQHGGASLAVESMLAEAGDPDQAHGVLGRRLRRGERIPGFGHSVYRIGDGRATFLLDRLRAAAPHDERLLVADAILADARRRHLPTVNVEFTLAVLADVTGMVTGAGETIFAISRTVGWLAHAIEEYQHPRQLRLRASYVGADPG